MAGRFDEASGRKGARYLPTPDRASLPDCIRYRPAHTPAYVPSDFDPALVPRSATLPAVHLERSHVYGYNGLGTLNKARPEPQP